MTECITIFVLGDFSARLGLANEGETGLENLDEEKGIERKSSLWIRFLPAALSLTVSLTEIHFSKRENTAAGHGSDLTARRIRKLIVYLQTEDGACSTQP
ncbi:hypothetical protein KIN20_027901 [Parelaphostrongylus tenuis]|uniref:Uncharacterized protein n=1 Tax=Parelaphostrongylus tenuis TaxID=148309 RepID=A0AAD5WEI6_PARTN|nr:hypothetical protein KIN20_027901 [Parelaphostrongylus tenuis]